MARRVKTVVIDDEGRDRGKAFLLTEMSAAHAEDWAAQAFLALASNGVEIPEAKGMAGIAYAGMRALEGLKFADLKGLMDQMMACVVRIPDLKRPTITRPLVEDDTEEVATRLQLKAEVFSLHTGFSFAGLRSKLNLDPAPPASSTIPTSQESLVP